MIAKIFHQGQNQADFIINYLFNEDKHSSYKPELVEGNPELTKNIINSLNFKHKYITGVLSFREGENLTIAQQHKLIEDFQNTFCPFDDPARVNFLWVRHFDKGRLELHFLTPRCAFMSDGSVKSFNIHPPGKANLLFWESFVRMENDYQGFEQVDGKKFKNSDRDFYHSVLDDLHKQRKQYIVDNYEKPITKIRKVAKYGRRSKKFTGQYTQFRNCSNVLQWKANTSGKIYERTSGRTNSPSYSSGGSIEDSQSIKNITRRTETNSKNIVSSSEAVERLTRLRQAANLPQASMSLDDQIMELVVSLQTCEPHEAPMLTAHLNRLYSMQLEQKYKRPKPK